MYTRPSIYIYNILLKNYTIHYYNISTYCF